MAKQEKRVLKMKTIPVELNLHSEQLYRFLSREGERVEAAFGRMASLSKMLTGEKELQRELKTWMDNAVQEMQKELNDVEHERQQLREDCSRITRVDLYRDAKQRLLRQFYVWRFDPKAKRIVVLAYGVNWMGKLVW